MAGFGAGNPYAIAPVNVNPATAQQTQLNLQDQAAQIQQRQAQAADFQIKAQQQQQAYADQHAITSAMIDSGGDHDKARSLALKYGASQASLTAWDKQLEDMAVQEATKAHLAGEAGELSLKNDAARHDQLNGQIGAIGSLPQEQRSNAFQQFMAGPGQSLIKPNEAPYIQSLLGDFSDPAIARAQAAMNSGTQVAKLALDKAQQLKTEADTSKTNAEIPGVTAESQMKQSKADLQKQAIDQFKDHPTTGGQVIDNVLPPTLDPQANASYKGAWQSAMRLGDLETAQKVIETAAQHAAAISEKLNPQVQQNEVKKAVAVEQATMPYKTAQAVETAKALRAGDNPALQGVPPGLLPQVQTAATKLDTDYITAKTAAEDVNTILGLAKSGNVAAGANVPLVGVGAVNAVNGIKRINSAEIQQYGTAGSLVQKIQGELGKWTEGKPIPDSVLKDMGDLHDQLSQGAYQKYTDGLSAINQRSGAKLAPAFPPPTASGSANTAPIRVKRKSDGKTGTINPGDFDANKYDKL